MIKLLLLSVFLAYPTHAFSGRSFGGMSETASASLPASIPRINVAKTMTRRFMRYRSSPTPSSVSAKPIDGAAKAQQTVHFVSSKLLVRFFCL
jgi:hypothetical protein